MRRSLVIAAALATVLIIAGSVYLAVPSLLSAPQNAGTTTSSTGSTSSISLSTGISTGSHSVSLSSASSSSSSSSSSAANAGDWTTYHADNARTGYLSVSNFTSVKSDWTSPTLDGAVYAEPLVFRGEVLVATENNSVYALSSQNGSILWRTNLGPPVAADLLPCGNIKPVTGITGTPVIDPSTGMLYVVSFSALHHTLSALDISTGAVVFHRSAVPPGFNDTTQQERSALSLANGIVYVPYGGLAGDCAQYYGWVVGLPENGTGIMEAYQVPVTREGAIWTPSGAAVDSLGEVYIATGNGDSTTTFDHGDSVIRLSPTLKEEGYFAPTNWAQLNQNDADLGSLGPAIVGPNTLFQIGKEGVGYLLNSSQLGGIGGQTFKANVCNESFGGTAYTSPYILVPCINGLFELQVANGAFTVALQISGLNAGPPIVTGGVAWTVDTNTATLYGFSVKTGHQAYTFPLGSVEHFTSPAAGEGRVFVAATDKVASFLLG
ncbi:MAG: PQQ-binding-like beta-propeller repeat protein [Thaumarchaeota archaeon]|nr:PQQ-binding-like beta-propeller repeat protein [Nitrososphaerota archaeon]